MLKSLFGNDTIEKVLLYLENYEEGFAAEIARTYNIPLNMVQKQLKRLEEGGIVVSIPQGRTRVYLWNPRYSFLKELRSLLHKAINFLPETEIKKYYRNRKLSF
jgi:predicted transcriptional regulator